MSLHLILNADDFGYEPAVTRGIAEAIRFGVVSSTTMMINSPWTEDALAQAQGLAIGLHLNLVRFAAISDPSRALTENDPWEHAFVVRETRAQLERFQALLGKPPTHIDVHKHAHRHPTVLKGLIDVAQQWALPVRSLDEDMRGALRSAGLHTNDVFLGDAGTPAYWTLERWVEHLERVPSHGVVEMMCHPGYAPTQLRSGYGVQREVELATFVSPACRQALKAKGLELRSWVGV